MSNSKFQKYLIRLSNSKGYKNYQIVRKAVLSMLNNNTDQKLSLYWQEELRGFDYMLKASPLIIYNLRHHSYHLTGLHEYQYRQHHAHSSTLLKNKLKYLKSKDKNSLLVPESPLLGGFGHIINGKLYNLDTLKFYECLITLDYNDQLNCFKKEKSKIILEIGSGWGGFAYQFKTLFPDITYVVVDLPQALLFSATYLITLFPNKKILFFDNFQKVQIKDIIAYDFVFIPNYLWKKLKFQRPDLIINMVSFQEMTTKQVTDYIKKCADWKCPFVYSLNRNCSPHNSQLTSVEDIMKKYYNTKEINQFAIPYTQLNVSTKTRLSQLITSLYSAFTKNRHRNSLYRYKHLLGTLLK